MTHLFDQHGARFLSIPAGQRPFELFQLSASMPMRFIRAVPERSYMERYFLGEENGQYAYLHRFVNGDGDRYVHSHPWDLASSLILCGGYEEVRRGPDRQTVTHRWNPGDINVITSDTLHQIQFTQPETWTLFVHSEWVRDWGFEREDGVMVRNQSDPDGTNRFWWTRPSALQLHAERSEFTNRECVSA